MRDVYDDVVVRHAVPGDAASIAEMVRKLAAFIGDESVARSTPESIVAHGFGDGRSFNAIVADRDGTLVGYAILTRTYSTWRAAPGVFVVDLYVDPDCRGAGVGRRLLALAADWGAEHGCAFMKLDVDPDNRSAHAFYERHGFRDDHDHAMVIEFDQLVHVYDR